MPNAFNFQASPFDCLTLKEQQLVRDNVDVAYFPQGAVILDVDVSPSHLLVIIKGYVTQLDGAEVVAGFGPDDCFDGRGLVAGKVSSRFVAAEEVVAYQLARQTVSDLIAANATFGALLFSDLGQKLSALSERQSRHELQSLTMSRVDAAYVRPPHYVDYQTDILSVVRLFQSHRVSNVLVRDARNDATRLGIFTATAVQRAVLDGRPLDQIAVGALSSFSLIKVKNSDTLGEAMALLLRHRVHRLVVVDENSQVVGVLSALDLFSFLSNQSHRITEEIEEASDLAGLGQAAAHITDMIARMYRSGSRVDLIAKIVQQLNARLFERAWTLIAPPDLLANSCLFVMGSEGRGEQLLKTDQDNGLILRDGYVPPANLDAICADFSAALATFGYPECAGHIMVNNPDWRHACTAFTQMARQWLLMPDADGLMKFAIFMDAHAVCGDLGLLDAVQQSLRGLATDNDAVLARFAAAMDAFGSHVGWWNRLLNLGEAANQLNIKKEGIFPLVHGVRSLALAHRVADTGTTQRIAALQAAQVLTPALASELADSLHFLMGLKLKSGLSELDQKLPVSGAIDIDSLSSLDRDLLKDTLGVVKRFKLMLRQRFHLDALS